MSETMEKLSKEKVQGQLVAERQDFIALLRQLKLEEWNTPSLCEGWKVRDVVAHVIGVQSDWISYLTSGGLNKANQKMVDKRANLPTNALIEQMEAIKQKPNLLANLATGVYVEDTWVHQQDVRWVLSAERQRKQDPERLRLILNIVGKSVAKKFPGVEFVATDLDWQAGSGQTVSGTAEAIIMAIMKRPAALKRLQGAGVALIKVR